MAAPIDSASVGQNQNIIDDLESSFLNCLSLLTTQEQINVQDSEETKTSIENAMQRFLELSRQTEAFFLRKKMLISYQKPEQLLIDDIDNLKAELARKEALLEKHTERLKRCQIILQQQGAAPGQPVQQPHPAPTQPSMQPPQSHPVPQQPHMAQGGPLPQYPSHHMQQMPSQGPGLPQYQGYSGSMHPQSMPGPPPPMQSHQVPMGQRPQAPPSYPQGPLAYLEQTTSNIGLPDRR
ncbi:mediator of RNA polymerase II transcription subunit 28-like [Mercenaria mercenaria]|uniref:mediator of RNA polymerase II transcription subunit 28-like n=1 Tax=Mercenaria mercenaria TaxID=6596 RepID=UPI00234E4CBD|nr:mediator of RNA polymerase II transcription subunit 28-like [Mercenaria mercenaria]